MRGKRQTFTNVVLFLLMIILFLTSCTEGNKKAPAATAIPSRATAAPTKAYLSESEARKIVEQKHADTYARYSVEGDPDKFGYDSIRSFSVSSIKCTKTTDTKYYFTLYGSFYGVDRYGNSVGKFTFDYEVSVDKIAGKFDWGVWARIKKN